MKGMRTTNILLLSYAHPGGEWMATTRLLEGVKKRLGKKITFTTISFTDGYKERFPFFEKQILIPHAKAKKPLSFIKTLFLDFKNARQAILEINSDLRNISYILVTHYLFLPQILSLRFLERKKVFFYFHGLKSGIFRSLDFRQIIIRVLEILSLIASNIIITPSLAAQGYVSSLLGPISRFKSFVLIPNSVSNEFFKKPSKKDLYILRKKIKVNEKQKIILYSGRIAKNKGLENLIAAFGKILLTQRSAVLVIAFPSSNKDDQLFEALQEKINKAKLKNHVKFIPDPKTNKLIRLYQISDVLVLASEIELAPLAIIEALACGTPCLGTDVGNMGEILSSINPSLVLKNNSPEEIFNKLNSFFVLPPKRRKEIKIKSRQTARYYSPHNSAKKFIQLLHLLDSSTAQVV